MLKYLLIFLIPFLIFTTEKIEVTIGTVYKFENSVSDKEVEKIHAILKNIIQATVDKNATSYLKFVSEKKGVYLDLKGLWDFETLVSEIKKEDSYFEIFFFDSERLKNYSQNPNAKTVRDLLILSNGIIVDYFFDSAISCEVKLRFKKNQNLQSDLNNAHFIRDSGKWIIYRFF
jgi:hypothetical protein